MCTSWKYRLAVLESSEVKFSLGLHFVPVKSILYIVYVKGNVHNPRGGRVFVINLDIHWGILCC